MTLAELGEGEEKFDVAILVGVLEHLRDLDEAFAHLRAILNPGGLLYVEEYQDATAFADWPNAPYQDFSTEHINFFAPVSLEHLMLRRGFSRVFLEQNHREQSYRTVMSNVSAVFRRQDVVPDQVDLFDADTEPGLTRYIEQCRRDDERLREKIDVLVETGQPLARMGRRHAHRPVDGDEPARGGEYRRVHRVERAVSRKDAAWPADHRARPAQVAQGAGPRQLARVYSTRSLRSESATISGGRMS